MREKHLLVVEDDRDIAHLMELHLADLGFAVTVAHDGLEGLELALTGRFDLVVLDLMLPGLDGLEICRRLRAGHPYVLVLMLTAKSSELDRVLGLEIGADDYLTKPFSLRELQARIKALLRRKLALSSAVPNNDAIVLGELSIDVGAREVSLAGVPIHLTAKEFDLLMQFARNPGRVYTRSQLLDLVWGYGYEGFEHTVNSHINRLRSKIERDPANPSFIQTVWGVGYKFADLGRYVVPLHLRLLLVLAALLLPAGILLGGLSVVNARTYFQEITQRQNVALAENLVSQSDLMAGELLDSASLTELTKMLAMTNPGVEIYVVTRDGTILDGSVAAAERKVGQIEVDAVTRFLANPNDLPVLGTDPRRGGRTIFSAGSLPSELGFLYVVLTNEVQSSLVRNVQTSTALRAVLWGSATVLVVLFLGGALGFALLTRRLRKLHEAMRSFRRGDFRLAAVSLTPTPTVRDEIDELQNLFLEVADHISGQYHELRRVDQNRRELVGNISHDLRTPLAALRGYLETLSLRGERLTREEREAFLAAAQAHGERLSKLIEQLFELSTLESSDGRAKLEVFPLHELVQDVVRKFAFRAEERGVTLGATVGTELPFVEGDIGLIERVLSNLLDNALRHTPAGGRVTIALEPCSQGVRVRISDTGEGIAANDLPRVFERFFRASTARVGEGTGLGLAIVRRILELHGRQIEVTSTEGAGAEFSFVLPVAG